MRPTDASVRARPSSTATLLSLVLLLATLLRVFHLGSNSLWLDEGITAIIAQLPWTDFRKVVWLREGNMACYYVLMRLWIHLGTGEATLRGLSVLFSVGTLPVVYLIGSKLFDNTTGLIATLLLSINTFDIRFAQEARGYSLTTFLVSLSFLLFASAVKNRQPPVWSWAMSSALAVYSHLFALFAIGAQVCLVLFLPARSGKRWQGSLAGLAILLIPAGVFAIRHNIGQLNWVPALSGSRLLGLASDFAGNSEPLAVPLLTLFVISTGAIAVRLRRRRPLWDTGGLKLVTVWLAFPIVAVTTISLIRPVFMSRFLLFCVPAFVLLVACGLGSIRTRIRLPLLGLIALLSAGVLRSYYSASPYQDWRSATKFLLSRSSSEDAIVFSPFLCRMPYEYYRQRIPRGPGPVVLWPTHAPYVSNQDFLVVATSDRLRSALQPTYPRLWLVTLAPDPGVLSSDLDRQAKAYLEQRYQLRETASFAGILAYLFVPQRMK